METSNHEVILGDQPRKIVVGADGKIESEFKKEFEIAGKDSGASAVIWICVKGLVGDAEPVNVSINGKGVGRLMPNKNADADTWTTQMLNFSASEGSLLPSMTKRLDRERHSNPRPKAAKPSAARFTFRTLSFCTKRSLINRLIAKRSSYHRSDAISSTQLDGSRRI